MLKALALDNILDFSFLKAKRQPIKVIKAQSSPLRFWLAVGLITANAVLMMSYIYGVNAYASSGYQIVSLQKKLAALTDDNKKINLKVSEAGSMMVIQNDFLSANYVAAGTPKFLQANQNQLTVR